MTASVIIPAHDEEALIGRLLEALTRGARERELEIFVVCNGCSDATAEVARRFGDPVRVIETEEASKTAALWLGDASASAFPRFYVDADVVLPLESLRHVASVLREGRYLAAAPRMRVDLSEAPWPVRAYYDIWLRLPYHTRGMIGSGVYAMTEEGRSRFAEFPDIISDDGFARLQFAPAERTTVESAWFSITPPKTLRGVVSVKTRSQKGAVQLHRAFPDLVRNDVRDYSNSFAAMLRDPRLWPKCLIYLYVILVTRGRAYWMNATGRLGSWERDESSRARSTTR